MPSYFTISLGSDSLHINWTIPEMDEDTHSIDYYIVRCNDDPPILVKNNSATLPVESEHNITVRAVDQCGQQGEELLMAYIMPDSQTSSHPDQVMPQSTAPIELLQPVTGDLMQTTEFLYPLRLM